MNKIPDDLLQNFAEFLDKELGLYYPKERYQELVELLMYDLKLPSIEKLIHYMSEMISNPNFKKTHFDQLTDVLTVSETYFFRPGCGLEEMKQHILPQLIKDKGVKDKTIRICSVHDKK